MIVDDGIIVAEPCPTCGSTHTVYEAVYRFWKCEDCSGVWAHDADDPDYEEVEDAPQEPGAGLPTINLTFFMTEESHPQEWETAWARLAELNGGDPVCECPDTGANWQYICTAQTEDGWMHYFKHRLHPVTRRRESLLIPCSPELLTCEELSDA